MAEPGDTIKLDAGFFPILGTLSMEGKQNIVIKGSGTSSTILNFSNQVEGAQGLSITNCNNITLEDFTVEEAKGDGIKCQYVNSITFRRIKGNKIVNEYVKNPGASLGPGPKAGPDGVTDNYYVKGFKYKLVPKKNGTYVQMGSGLEVKKLF